MCVLIPSVIIVANDRAIAVPAPFGQCANQNYKKNGEVGL